LLKHDGASCGKDRPCHAVRSREGDGNLFLPSRRFVAPGHQLISLGVMDVRHYGAKNVLPAADGCISRMLHDSLGQGVTSRSAIR